MPGEFPAAVMQAAYAQLQLNGHDMPKQGEINQVIIGRGDPDVVIKTPLPDHPLCDTAQMLQREVAVVRFVEASGADLGVAVPAVIAEHLDQTPPWAAFRYTEGKVLDTGAILALPRAELLAHGAKIGEFVAALATAIDPSDFVQRIDRSYGASGVDRLEMFARRRQTAPAMLEAKGYPNLARIVESLAKDCAALDDKGLLTPRIVGHDDLQPGNCAFKSDTDGQMTLSAVFDFAIAKPSVPEREFRFLHNYDSEVVAAAAQAYTEATGDHVSEEATRFWHRLQHIVSCVLIVELGRTPPAAIIPLLEIAYPNIDWEEEISQKSL